MIETVYIVIFVVVILVVLYYLWTNNQAQSKLESFNSITNNALINSLASANASLTSNATNMSNPNANALLIQMLPTIISNINNQIQLVSMQFSNNGLINVPQIDALLLQLVQNINQFNKLIAAYTNDRVNMIQYINTTNQAANSWTNPAIIATTPPWSTLTNCV